MPLTLFLHPILELHSSSVTLILLPLPDIVVVLVPGKFSLSVLFVLLVAAFVGTSILPLVMTISMLFVLEPFTIILTAILPFESTIALHFPVFPLPVIHPPIGEVVSPQSVPSPVLELTNITIPIRINFLTLPILHIINPVAPIYCLTISMLEHTISISFVMCPISLKHISIIMDKCAFSTSLILPPLPIILCSIWPDLFTLPMLMMTLPLTLILDTVLELCHGFPLNFSICILCWVLKLFFFELLLIDIFAIFLLDKMRFSVLLSFILLWVGLIIQYFLFRGCTFINWW